MNISVVIPNYNGVQLFPETLPTVFEALDHSGLEYEVILIDDCSTDHSVQYLQENYPQIRLFSNEKNSGFSKTINKGIQNAHFDLILLLNSDIKLTPGYFEKQVGYFTREDTFGVMGKITGWSDGKVQDGGKYPLWQGFKLKTSLNYLPQPGSAENYTLYLSGANALVDRKKLTGLGGFNEDYSPFYIEDVDLSVRAWRMGWKCYFEQDAVCLHQTSTSIKSKDRKEYIKTIYNRNKLYFHAFHLTGPTLFGWWLQTIFELLFRTLFLQFYYIRSFRSFLTLLPAIQSKKEAFNHKVMRSVMQISRDIRQAVKAISFFRA